VIIYSFDSVLRARKTIHSVELTPGGGHTVALWRPVPVIAGIYFAAVWAVLFIAARLPVLDVVSQMFAPLVYYVAFPAGIVWLSMNAHLDGRSPHKWAISYLLYLRRIKRTIAGRKADEDGTKTVHRGKVSIWWDITAPRMHHGWVAGGRITTAVGVRFTHALLHRHQVVRPDDDRRPVLEHDVERRLEIRP
jgi:hypothetical protein